eukprot:EG_transcript_23041
MIEGRLNLVDLADSERTSLAARGRALQEGSCLRAVVEERKPNFRDSKLTLLLQDSITIGMVILIAVVSPASGCFHETLSTLRFADSVQQAGAILKRGGATSRTSATKQIARRQV